MYAGYHLVHNIYAILILYLPPYRSQEHQKYFILLILTDGVINDIDLTKQALIRASQLPLSVIIIGMESH
ncbi:hypothetical protein EON65_53020 [archaeon]|nr:MAG: hypothetical protein EON65_53020 [archaeon]